MVSSRESRQKQEDSGKIPIRERKRSYADTEQASISGLRNVTNVLWTNDYASYFETLLRRLVREVVEQKVQGHLFSRERVNQAGISGAKPLQLCFIKKLPGTIFTQSNVIAEDESPLQIALFDVKSGSIVNDGSLSSLKIEICVLGGEFGSYGSEDWTEDEFNANTIRERDGKRPLLVGERFITLKNGVGWIPKISFTDNSRWQRSGKFRLGAKVVQSTSNRENIKEGRSEPFVVKDNRGELYKKHIPPSLNDEIWRLKKIAKDGQICKRLSLHGIHTVKDLLQLYITNESSLYEKFGNIQKKSRLTIIEHAKTCVIDDDKLYSYHSAEPPIGLVFNSIFVLVGVTFDWQNYYSPDTLAPYEKHLVEIVKQQAYQNGNNLKLIEAKLNDLNLATCLKARQFNTPNQGLLHINISTPQDQPVTLPGYGQPFNSAANIDEGMHDYQINADQLPDIREMPQTIDVEHGFSCGMYTEGNNYHLNGSQIPPVQGSYELDNESSGIQFINGWSPCTTWEPESSFSFGSFFGEEYDSYPTFLNSAVHISSNGKPKAVWYKIRVALKFMSVKRDAAARKKAQLFYYNY
ncbi:hypothetical protein VNO77_18285 [Canavalia gladiata]|uniref:Uncharacterized protein n=1 Tax=Canavalia gladiata TaxID=3824 RepID=A0AAN9QHI2_CANGL